VFASSSPPRANDIKAFDGDAEPVLRGEELKSETRRVAPDVASNAVDERRKGLKVRAVAALQPERIFLLVHRIDFSVYFRRIEREDYAMLMALRAGKPIAAAIELAFKESSIPEFNRGGYIRHCLETWATLGWFCQPAAGRWESGKLKKERCE
jgi:hypothetical protein